MATLDSLCSARAVSSIKLVSRSEHSSELISLALAAESCDKEGTGRIVELNDAAISIRVSLISFLSASKGISSSSFIFSLSSDKVGKVELSLTRVSSKPVGIWTFSSPDKLGIVNSGTEMLMLTLLVRLLYVSLIRR